MKISNKTYDAIKYVALVVLPALGTLYFALSQIWHLPAGEEVVGTITAIDAFLGVIWHVTSQQYRNSDAKYDGHVEIVETPEKKTYSLNLKGDPNDIDQKDDILLKVGAIPAVAATPQ